MSGKREVEAAGLRERLLDRAVAGLAGIAAHAWSGDALSVTTDAPHRLMSALLRQLEEQGVEVRRLTTHQASLEDVFVHLTGRFLRDEAGA